MTYNTRKLKSTPQTQQSLNTETPQVENNAGGFVFAIDKWAMLERFLILGSEKGSYYITEQEMTRDNAKNLIACIRENPARTIETIARISDEGRAPKNTPALFALALCLDPDLSTVESRKLVYDNLLKVIRTGTHFLNFVEMVKGLRGFGRGVRKGLSNWYNQDIDRLAMQMVKYRQRDGWSQRDALRVIHPQAANDEQNALLKWVVNGEVSAMTPGIVHRFIHLQEAKTTKEVVAMLSKDMTWEMIPTDFLKEPKVWEQLIENKMPLTALLRNLGRMSANGTLKPLSAITKEVIIQLTDAENVRKSRIHPISVLAALMTYGQGRGMKGTLTWDIIPQIKDALDDMFYMSFKNVSPTGKNINLGIDISPSMFGAKVAGMEYLTAAVASAAIAMTIARTEKNYMFSAFTHEYVPIDITAKDTLDAVIKKTNAFSGKYGRTDCALPMTNAIDKKLEFDAFYIFTDNETYAGRIHPFEALKQYRRISGRPAKLAVCATSATKFSIADPSDAGMMDFVGFDSNVPQLLNDFIK